MAEPVASIASLPAWLQAIVNLGIFAGVTGAAIVGYVKQRPSGAPAQTEAKVVAAAFADSGLVSGKLDAILEEMKRQTAFVEMMVKFTDDLSDTVKHLCRQVEHTTESGNRNADSLDRISREVRTLCDEVKRQTDSMDRNTRAQNMILRRLPNVSEEQ